jgi:ABC-type sugar transport system ATPase subunit
MTPSEQTDLAVEVRGATKAYGPIVALGDVSFRLRRGEVHALLGHNGAGKSTLVKVLAGVVSPDQGEVLVGGRPVELKSPRHAQAAGIAVVEQELSVVPTLTVQENILLGSVDAGLSRSGGADREAIKALLARLGLTDIGPDTMVEDLSIAERQLVEIARALSRDARVLILDEPTATLGEHEIVRVFAAVRELVAEGRSVIFVSHRLGEVLELCSRVTVMRDGKVTASRDVEGLDREGIVQLMLGDVAAKAEVEVAEGKRQAGLVAVEDLAVPGHVEDFSLRADGGEIIGIAGQVGSGASEVLRALAGLVPDARGRVTISGRAMRLGAPSRSHKAGVVFASNDRKSEGLFLTQSIARNLVATRLDKISSGGVMSGRKAGALARRLADLIKVDHQRLSQAAETLSGGNQQKVFLGRCLDRDDAVLLLFDEPTRGVDVGGRAEIHNLIRHAASGGNSVIFVSTDHEEVLDLADTVVTMFAGKVTRVARRGDMSAATILGDMTQGGEQTVVAA